MIFFIIRICDQKYHNWRIHRSIGNTRGSLFCSFSWNRKLKNQYRYGIDVFRTARHFLCSLQLSTGLIYRKSGGDKVKKNFATGWSCFGRKFSCTFVHICLFSFSLFEWRCKMQCKLCNISALIFLFPLVSATAMRNCLQTWWNFTDLAKLSSGCTHSSPMLSIHCYPRGGTQLNWTRRPCKQLTAHVRKAGGGRLQSWPAAAQRPSGCKGKAVALSVVCPCRECFFSFAFLPVQPASSHRLPAALHSACLMRRGNRGQAKAALNLGAGMWHAKSPKGGGGPCRHAAQSTLSPLPFLKGLQFYFVARKGWVGYFIGVFLFPILNCFF